MCMEPRRGVDINVDNYVHKAVSARQALQASSV